MKKLIFATAVAGSLFGLAAGTAGQAQAAGPALTIGSAPLELCPVDSIRPGRTTDIRGNHVVFQPVYLTANC